MGMTLAYRLATDPALTRLLDSLVVLMIPSMNPDGLDTWWRGTAATRGHATSAARSPGVSQYVGHDNTATGSW